MSRSSSPAHRAVPGAALPEGVRVYAVGDVHGRDDLLADLHARIDAHCAADPPGAPRETIEVYLGDLVDRGPDSRGVIERLLARGRERRVVALSGNHEGILLGVLADPGRLGHWLANGALATLVSYGVAVPPGADADASEVGIVAAFRAALPPEHLGFLEGLGTHFALGGYVFVHAGLRPGVPLGAQSREDLLWIRRAFLDSDADHGAVVVHGHTPGPEVEFRANRINLDTRAYASGVLSCLVLEGGSASLIQTRGPSGDP